MYKMVLLRCGESTWNKENRFAGWTDVDLSEKGRGEARRAGEVLRAEGFTFDVAFTSVLKRAIRTLWFVQDELDLMWIPTTKAWQLNERHYGALQGLNKAETAAKQRLQAGATIPGWKLTSRRGSQFIRHEDVAACVERFGLSQVLASYGNLSASKLRELWERSTDAPFPEEIWVDLAYLRDVATWIDARLREVQATLRDAGSGEVSEDV